MEAELHSDISQLPEFIDEPSRSGKLLHFGHGSFPLRRGSGKGNWILSPCMSSFATYMKVVFSLTSPFLYLTIKHYTLSVTPTPAISQI